MVQLSPEDFERPFATGSARRLLVMLGRALALRCPNCGSRGLLANWFRMHERCPTCGLRVEREGSDYMAGSLMFNIVLAEMIFAAMFVAYLLITWPRPNWDMLEIAAPVGDGGRAVRALSVLEAGVARRGSRATAGGSARAWRFGFGECREV